MSALNEADTRVKLIDPALAAAGWDYSLIRREVQVTDGRLYLVGDVVHQADPKRADYILYLDNFPVAVVEAKDESHSPGSGLQQAKQYAEMLDLSLAYSTNGKGFVEFDYATNHEAQVNMADFPTPVAVSDRLLLPSSNQGNPLTYPYNTAKGLFPRYYQDVAIRRSLEAILGGRQRLLLTLATGTGKTFIAAQLVWKLYRTSRVRRVLFLTDRVFLRGQAFNDFGFFAGPDGDPRYVVEGAISKHHDLYFAIYPGLYSEQDGSRLFEELPANFFDLIVIDECHRSGFGTWRKILDRFGSAIHLGLTATPKRSENVDTYAYFGDPIYSYSLGQGIEDGFLATYKVHKVRTNLDKIGGVDVEDAVVAGAELFIPEGRKEAVKDFYSVAEFAKKIALPDWVEAICNHLAATMSTNDPMEKTIVFCVNMDHALEVRGRLQNAFSYLGLSDFAVRIVSEESYNRTLLEKFRSDSSTPVVATTVDLLSTGVDLPAVRNIVFVKPVGSEIVFKQIVGRGCRLHPATDKKWFRIIDYSNATRLFDEWDKPQSDARDLPPEPWEGLLRFEVRDKDSAVVLEGARAVAVVAPNIQKEFDREDSLLVGRDLPEKQITVQISAPHYVSRTLSLEPLPTTERDFAVVELRPLSEKVERISLAGVQVEIADEVLLTMDATGKQLTVEQYLQHARDVVAGFVTSREALLEVWLDKEKRMTLIHDLELQGVHATLIAELERLPDADAFDVLAHLALGDPLVSRSERAIMVLNESAAWVDGFDEPRRKIILDILEAYSAGGISQLERQILSLDRFKRFGGPLAILKVFGGTVAFDAVLIELQRRIYGLTEVA